MDHNSHFCFLRRRILHDDVIADLFLGVFVVKEGDGEVVFLQDSFVPFPTVGTLLTLGTRDPTVRQVVLLRFGYGTTGCGIGIGCSHV